MRCIGLRRIGRRRIGLGLIALACAAVAAASPVRADEASRRQTIHLLDSVAFGPTLGDVQRVEAMGIDRYIDEQLAPERIPEDPELARRLAGLDTLRLDPVRLFQLYGPPPGAGPGLKPSPDEIKAARQRSRVILRQAAEARLLRAATSRRQLQEVMVDFWFNHFNVFAGKGLDHLWVGAYEEQAIRPYAMGRFRDLLLATARHPAMLVYLDNAQNVAPGTIGGAGKELGLNENYAREVMELHTLGVGGGYSQGDVTSLARILTGWSIVRRGGSGGGLGGFFREVPPISPTGFAFYDRRHEFGPKALLGRQIAATGEAEGVEALDMLARHPATARHIAFELAQYFVADAPPAALVDRLAARFRETDGDIRAVLKVLLTSREFRTATTGATARKYKTPFRYVLSAVRASGLPIVNPRPLLGAMAQLGQPLYGCQTPDGYKNTQEAWLSPDATTRRVSFATALAHGGLPVTRPAPPELDNPPASPQLVADGGSVAPPPPGLRGDPVDPGRLDMIYGPVLSSRTREAIAASPSDLHAALILGSPDFMQQ